MEVYKVKKLFIYLPIFLHFFHQKFCQNSDNEGDHVNNDFVMEDIKRGDRFIVS